MPATKITEDWRGIGFNGTVSLTGETGSLSRRFVVSFDNSEDASSRAIIAITASVGGVSIPEYWETHPYNPDFFVVRKSVAPENGPLNWVVTVEYEYVEGPFVQPYSIQYAPQSSQEAIDKAVEGTGASQTMTKNLCNSADEPFDPPIQEEFFDFSLIIKRNESSFNMFTSQQYLNTVNSDYFNIVNKDNTVLIFEPGTVRCKSIQADEQRHGDTWYYAVTYEFVIRKDGWKRRILDQGFREKSGLDYVAIKDAEGNPITMPAKLNGSGAKLSSSGTPVFLEFQTKFEKEFSAFEFY